MKLRTVDVEGKTYAEVDGEGRVLYDNEGKEFAFDAGQTYGKIQELTKEAASNREAKTALETKIKALDGIDPAKYKEAVEAFDKLDKKNLLDAGEVDRMKKEIEESYKQTYEPKLAESQKELETLRSQYSREKLSSAFAGSKYINEQLASPPDMVMATFGDQFKTEDGKLVAYDASGNTIYSRKNPGEVAGFDEAMEQIVSSYQYRDRILKASNQEGTGGDQGNGTGPKRRISREQFGAMSPAEQSKVAKAISEGSVSISD